MVTLTHDDYEVGWICALPLEGAAAMAMLDEQHETLRQNKSDDNTYHLGRIGKHNVVIVCLPIGRTGTNSASTVAAQMRFSFGSIRIILMVGIGGGIPGGKHDIRLGDVVVSKPGSKNSGVVQYDFGKTEAGGEFICTNTVDATSPAILSALSAITMKGDYEGNTFARHISQIPAHMSSKYAYPGAEQDQLFETNYDHVGGDSCETCDPQRLVNRPPRVSSDPVVHYGTILSGNRVVKDGGTRDELREKHDALCIEMEAAGLMNHFRCAVIRGISDYSDTHKNKKWQHYAAAAAAAYGKELLGVISPEGDSSPPLSRLSQIPKTLSANQDVLQTLPSHRSKPDIGPTSFFMLSVPSLINVLDRLILRIIVELHKHTETKSCTANLVEQFKTRQNAMHNIFSIIYQESNRSLEFEQSIEDELPNLYQSLTRTYREGVVLEVFEGSGPRDSTKVAFWGETVMSGFLKEYDEWEDAIRFRLRMLQMVNKVEDTSPKETIYSTSSLGVSSEEVFNNSPIDNDQLIRLRCSWIARQKSSAATLVEFRCYDKGIGNNPAEMSHFRQNFLDTVRFLNGSDDRLLNIPKCIGHYHDIGHERFVMIHAMPRDYGHPRSLRDVLTNAFNGLRNKKSPLELAAMLEEIIPNDPNFIDRVLKLAKSNPQIHPLEDRIRVATQLAKSIQYLHLGGLVHKRISPENILLLTRAGVDKHRKFPYALGDPLLVGFDRARGDQAISRALGELDIFDCLYHHPERWGIISGMRFSMLHDIYSLGVVLLEIGLWESMIVWLPKEFGFPRKRYIAWKVIRDMFDENAESLRQDISPEDVQAGLIQIAKYSIHPLMGTGYKNVVISCLSGKFNSEKMVDLKDHGIGLLYVNYIISKLEKLKLS